jgi:pSer/pThr/pTyr-binding forkhead associated (FHA) protein
VVAAAPEATPPVDAEPAGTRISHAHEPAASRSHVEFSTGPPARKIDDDTKDVVTPKAIQYLMASNTITVSRLVLLKDGTETSFPLTRDTYTLGRHRNNDIVVSDPKVSSFHARLDRGSDGFTFVDLKSRNGSFVNGRRSTTALLKTGDELRLGTAKLVYRIDYTSGSSG